MSNNRNVGRIPETGVMTAYERWELPSLDEKDEAANEVEIEPVTSEEVDQIRSDAYDDGFSEGQKTGYQEGFSKGEKEGHQKGYSTGQQEGHSTGLTQGKDEGLTQARVEVDAQVSRLSELMAQFDAPQAALTSDLQESLLNVVTAVSRTVVHRELQTDTSQVKDLLKQGLEQMESSREQLQVLVNPADLIYIEQAAEEAGATWKIQADDSIMPGGLKLKSGPSLVDLTAEQRFQQAVLNLLGRTDWAIDLASDQASEQQKALTSLNDGYDRPSALPVDNEDGVNDDVLAEETQPEALESPDDNLNANQDVSGCDDSNQDVLNETDSNEMADINDESTSSENTQSNTESEDLASSEPLASESPKGEDELIESMSEPDVIEPISEPIPEDVDPIEAPSTINDIQDELVSESIEQSSVPPGSSQPQSESIESETIQSDSVNLDALESDAKPSDVIDAESSEPEMPEHVSSHSVRDAMGFDSTDIDEGNGDSNSFEGGDDFESIPSETLLTEEERSALSEDVFDFDANEQDEHTTVYPENQKVSDLIAQEEHVKSDDVSQVDNTQATNSPEVQSMMNPAPQGNGFQAFGWQAPQAQQAQAQAQQAQMQANAASVEAQQAQARAQQAQAQAHQAQAHAQAMNQQAMNQQAMNQQMMNQQAAAQGYQPQYAPQQGMPMQPGMSPQGYAQPAMPQAGYQQPMMQGGMPSAPMPQGQPGQGNWGMHQGMAVQPVPMMPASQGNFSAFNFSGSPQGGQQQPAGFMPYQYPVA